MWHPMPMLRKPDSQSSRFLPPSPLPAASVGIREFAPIFYSFESTVPFRCVLSVVPLVVSTYGIVRREGGPVFHGVLTDITGRKACSEPRFKRLFDGAPPM